MPHATTLALHQEVVLPEWIDYNGHMNLAYYVLAFDHASDAFFDYIGLDENYRNNTHNSIFTLEIHVNYRRELMLDDRLRCTTQLLNFDRKRIHYYHAMYHAQEDYLAASNELIVLHVDMNARRGAALPETILHTLAEIRSAHQTLPTPDDAGSVIGIRRK